MAVGTYARAAYALGVGTYARAAYALGWATIDDPHTLPIGPAGLNGSRTATALAETLEDRADLIALIIETGRTDAARTALHRARIRLYSQHRKLIVAAAAGLHHTLDRSLLTRNLLLTADQPRKVRQQQAATTLTAAVASAPGVGTAWGQANQNAAAAAAARGWSEAASSPPGGGPPDPKTVTAGLAAAAAAIGALNRGHDWTGRQISRQAWDLAGLDLADAPDPEQAVTDSLDTMDGVGAAAEDQMHQALSGAFADYFTTGPGATLGLIDLVTEMDNRVCVTCQDLSEEGPYDPATAAALLPVHPVCRCWLELA